MSTEPELNPNVFTPDRIWQAYAASLASSSDAELATILGVSEARVKEWKTGQPAFYRAVVAARSASSKDGSAGALAKHLGNALPKDLRELWDELEGDDMTAKEQVMYSLSTRGDYDRQRLLVHALASTRFDLNRCCRMLDISKAQIDRWAKDDPRFVRLWQEVHFQKQNFVESALMQKIEEGSEKAIIHASQTLNRDRGYGQSIEVKGTVQHLHAHVDLGQLDLDVDTRAKILEACRQAGMVDMDGLLIEDQQTVNAESVAVATDQTATGAEIDGNGW
jgi:hypothetical protein